jgi:glyoxylase-like metal-dependent hydrolase (beta-lactamase superfamily II)
MIHIEHFTFNAFQTRCSIVWDDDNFCAFVDPGCSTAQEISAIVDFVSEHNLKPVCIMLTHGHFDHIYGVSELSRIFDSLPVYMHKDEKFTMEETNPYVCRMYGLPLPDVSFTDTQALKETVEGDIIEVGNLRFQAIETPGHSRGGLCFYEASEQVLFSGDTLFAGAIGRTDQPGGDYDQLMKSIFEKLMTLDGDVKVIPGHGPCSDITTENMTNPFLQPFNEPYED